MDYLNLIRYKNLIIIAITQYLMRWCIINPMLKINEFKLQFSEFDFALFVFCTILIAAAGYIINDYFDSKTDLINRPNKVIVGHKIDRRLAIILHTTLNFIAVVIGFYISFKIGIWKIGFIFPLITGLLWYYSTSYKYHLIGNIIVSLLTALVPFLVAIYEVPMLNKAYGEIMKQQGANFNYLIYWMLGFSFFAFLVSMIREIIKDAEDSEGDMMVGRNTLPIMLGIKYTKIVLYLIIGLTIISILSAWKMTLNDYITLSYFLTAIIAPLLFLTYKIIKATTKKDFHFASGLVKIIMITGVSYSLVVYYIINQTFNAI